jgi:hypothetical protein
MRQAGLPTLAMSHKINLYEHRCEVAVEACGRVGEASGYVLGGVSMVSRLLSAASRLAIV